LRSRSKRDMVRDGGQGQLVEESMKGIVVKHELAEAARGK
jgi:hypothetical protein